MQLARQRWNRPRGPRDGGARRTNALFELSRSGPPPRELGFVVEFPILGREPEYVFWMLTCDRWAQDRMLFAMQVGEAGPKYGLKTSRRDLLRRLERGLAAKPGRWARALFSMGLALGHEVPPYR